MDVDEDLEVETTSGDDGNDIVDEVPATKLNRYKKLGFYPQKEIYCNKYLPYADQLDDESQVMLAELKEYLARAVVHRELTPAISSAIAKLMV